jgi:hypothetical protein
VSKMRVDVHEKVEPKAKFRYYEIIGPNAYGRLLLIRQPDALVIDSGTQRLSLLELERDIERRIDHR